MASSCYAFPTGAPTDSCPTLIPAHPKKGPDGKPTSEIIPAQTEPSPYKLEAKVLNCDLVELTISGEDFKGFMIRAFNKDTDEPVEGTFLETKGLQTIKCKEDGDTATHVDPSEKNNFVFQWKFPDGCKEELNVYYKGSIAKSYSRYWEIESNAVTLKQ